MKLFILAAHLQDKDINAKYPSNKFCHFVHNGIVLFNEDDGVHFNFIFPYVVKELPRLFKEWSLVGGKITYNPQPILSDVVALCEFMGLESEEFISVFIPFQNNKLGLKTLHPEARPIELSERIYAFLDYALAQRTQENQSNSRKNQNKYL